MAYEFEVVGWEHWSGHIYNETPYESDLPDVGGVFVHFYDRETGDEHYTWIYVDPPAEGEEWSWDDWYDLIDGILGDHGYAMA